MRKWIISMVFLICLLCNAITVADIEIHFLDVGQGDSTIIVCDGEVMMIDGGSPEASQMIYTYLTQTLGIEHIDKMVLTHPHRDHVGGLPAALTACTVDEVYTSLLWYDEESFLTFKSMLQERNQMFTMPIAGTTVNLGSARVLFLAPEKMYDGTNNKSIVLVIEYGERRFLFIGDAESAEENELLQSRMDLHADVLKVAHHGSKTSSMETLLEVVQPQIALIGVGIGNSYGHPSLEVLGRLRDQGTKVYRTDLHGTIILVSDGHTLEIRTDRVPGNSESVYTLSWPMHSEAESEHPEAEYYVGNARSLKFHLPECEGVQSMSENNKVIFESRNEAINSGYHACGTCKP